MKSKKGIKNILIVTAMVLASLFFINMSLAANTAKVTVETANLRETPDENSKILEQLSLNKEVEIVEKEGDWYKVTVDNITGYLRQDLIAVTEEVNTTQDENNITPSADIKSIENQIEEKLVNTRILNNIQEIDDYKDSIDSLMSKKIDFIGDVTTNSEIKQLVGQKKAYEEQLKNGAEFVVAKTGKIMTMPGLPKIPAAEQIDIDENGNIIGIF